MNRIMGYSKLILACAILTCSLIAAAQGGGGGGGGGQRGGYGQRGGGFNDATGFRLLSRADVQRDLALTAEQKDKITAMQEEMRAAGGFGGGRGGGGGAGGGGGTPPDRQAMQEAMAKRNAETMDKMAKILSADQMKRLKEIRIQIAKNSAIMMPDIQKDLAITDEQKTKIADLMQKAQQANRDLRDQGLQGEELQAARTKNNDILNTELGKLLTADQAKKLKDMAGKEFKADPPPGGGG